MLKRHERQAIRASAAFRASGKLFGAKMHECWRWAQAGAGAAMNQHSHTDAGVRIVSSNGQKAAGGQSGHWEQTVEK